MTGKYVYKKDLEEVYGESLSLTQDFNSNSNSKVKLSKDKYRIEVINQMGKISLVKTLSQAGNVTKFAVLTKMIKNEEVPNAKELFSPILDIYHKDHYLITAQAIYIHYPVLEIKNSLDMKHTIYDLVVLIPIQHSNCIIGNDLQGLRTSFTQKEINSGYVHSHLHRSRYDFNAFCKGGGSHFDKFLLSLNKSVDAEEFELFIIQLKEYVSWESLEGQPYMSIKAFYGGGNSEQAVQVTPQYNTNWGSSQERYVKETIVPAILDNGATKLSTCFMKLGNIYMFDPALDPAVWIEFEKQFVYEPSLQPSISDWNPETNRYHWNSFSSNGSFPSFTIPSYIQTAFKLTPKLIQQDQEQTPQVILKRRFSTTLLLKTIGFTNDQLILNQYND